MSWGVVTKRKTKKIESPDGKFFVVIQKLSQGDKDDLNDILANMEIAGKSEKQLANMNLGKMRAYQRKCSVTDWNIPELDQDGNPTGKVAPINDESLRNISEELAEAIDEAIEELNPEKIGEDKKKL